MSSINCFKCLFEKNLKKGLRNSCGIKNGVYICTR